MKAFNWLTDHFSKRGKALLMYKRGMAKAKKHDHQGAIHDYTMTIDLPDTPPNLKAMVLYNRALVHVANGDVCKGAEDLEAVLAMEQAPENVKTMARQKLAKKAIRSGNSNVLKH